MSNIQNLKLTDLRVSTTEAQAARRASFKAQTEQFADLVASIEAHGVLQAIIVRPNGKNGKYEIVAGERRFLASGQAGLETIPANVRELDDKAVIEIQLIENLQRADVHPMHEAEGYNELMHKHGHTVEDVQAKVGKSRSYVFGRLKLLALSAPARKAFYDGNMSASIALLVARIPSAKLQREALAYVADPGRPLSFRHAKETIAQKYTLRLGDASFDVADAGLVKKAGACGDCSFRSGNQRELFSDIKSADVCTNPPCFASKVRAHGNRAIAEAKKAGRKVILAKDAKAIKPYKFSRNFTGYVGADSTCYETKGGKSYRSIMGPEAETVVIQCPETGEAIDVYKETQVRAAVKKINGGTASPLSKTEKDNRNAVRIEKAFRLELYSQCRTKLKRPSAATVARTLFERLGNDAEKMLCKLRDFEPPKKKHKYGYVETDYDAMVKDIETWSPAVVNQFINDCIYVTELSVWNGKETSPALVAAAESVGVDPKAVRQSVTPKKKVAKKKVAKARPPFDTKDKKDDATCAGETGPKTKARAKAMRKPPFKKATRKKAATGRTSKAKTVGKKKASKKKVAKRGSKQ